MSRCPKCKFRVRGKNHEEGTHHSKGRPRRESERPKSPHNLGQKPS